MKDIDYSYTMEKAIEDAKEHYKINGNRKIIDKKFCLCKLSNITDYVDKYNIKYSDVHILPCEEKVDWAKNYTAMYVAVNFVIQLKDEELKQEIKELAGELYRASLVSIMEKALENENIGGKMNNEMIHGDSRDLKRGKYTKEGAMMEALKFYEDKNKCVILRHKEFKYSCFNEVIDFVDSYNADYSNIIIMPFNEVTEKENSKKDYFDIYFSSQMTNNERKDAIVRLAKRYTKVEETK